MKNCQRSIGLLTKLILVRNIFHPFQLCVDAASLFYMLLLNKRSTGEVREADVLLDLSRILRMALNIGKQDDQGPLPDGWRHSQKEWRRLPLYQAEARIFWNAMYEQIFNKMPCSRIYITNMSSFLPEARELLRRHLFQSKSQRPSKHQWRPQMFVVYKIAVVAIVFTKGIHLKWIAIWVTGGKKCWLDHTLDHMMVLSKM